MRQNAEGRLHDRIHALGSVAYPGYVVRGDRETAMIDAGINWLGPRYLASLRELLGDPPTLTYLFLTHSHYDHLGAASYLARHLPGLLVGSHERVARVLHKPSALKLMNRLSDSHTVLREECAAEATTRADTAGADTAPGATRAGTSEEDLSVQPFAVDLALKEGDEVHLGGLTCRVLEVPGHTRDSLAFHFPEIGALFVGDACGVLEAGPARNVRVEFLASYQEYLDSMARIKALRPEMLCLAHSWVLTGEDVSGFLDISMAETERHRELIERYLDAAGGDVPKAVEDLGRDEYDIRGGIRQERAAYMTNLAAQVRHIAGLRQ